jgi:4-hydroxy-tetrahydrodipicolinate reductase
MVKVVICGASGRMGQTLGRFAHEAPDLELAGGIDLKPGSFFGAEIADPQHAPDLLKLVKPDVLIDFTVANAAVANVKMAAEHNIALVVGTTGFTQEQRAEMERAVSGRVPAVISSNFSVGVNIFWQLVREAGRLLKDYDIEVTEAHHRKRPSCRSSRRRPARGRRPTAVRA